jgi:endonuclease I
MKKFTKNITAVLAAVVAFASLPALPAIYTQNTIVASAASTDLTPTGFDSADDVNYKTVNNTVVNWGSREEDCTFLSTYAQAFYTDNNTFAYWSTLGGNSNTSSTPSSDLYKALKSYMSSKHKNINNYDKNKETAKYTDCVKNGYDKYISSFYSGLQIGPSWDGSWNREHTWPNSKGEGSAENDVMMIRPTSTSENGSRGNTAYGESSGYYHPNSESGGTLDLRGDCARIVLYVYTRWGNTSKMWGSGGVMESKSVLLEWMEADPVDTWEMGRNDSVQSIVDALKDLTGATAQTLTFHADVGGKLTDAQKATITAKNWTLVY